MSGGSYLRCPYFISDCKLRLEDVVFVRVFLPRNNSQNIVRNLRPPPSNFVGWSWKHSYFRAEKLVKTNSTLWVDTTEFTTNIHLPKEIVIVTNSDTTQKKMYNFAFRKCQKINTAFRGNQSGGLREGGETKER